MFSAFGVEHGDISKASDKDKRKSAALLAGGTAAGVTALNTNRIANTVNNKWAKKYSDKAAGVKRGPYGIDESGKRVVRSEAFRGRKNLTSEQKIRRGVERKENVRNAKRKETLYNSYRSKANKVPFTPNRRSILMNSANAIAAPSVFFGARNLVEKSNVKRRDVDAAVAGGLAAGAGYQALGYSLKPVERKLERRLSQNPKYVAAVKEHREKIGLPKNAPAGHEKWRPYFRNYPTNVPGGKLKRAISVTHTGKSGTAINAGVAALGAGAAAKSSYDRRSKK
jgi:hypothetical protein